MLSIEADLAAASALLAWADCVLIHNINTTMNDSNTNTNDNTCNNNDSNNNSNSNNDNDDNSNSNGNTACLGGPLPPFLSLLLLPLLLHWRIVVMLLHSNSNSK